MRFAVAINPAKRLRKHISTFLLGSYGFLPSKASQGKLGSAYEVLRDL